MPKMYKLTLLAEQDLADIFDYTVETWGSKKAKAYIKQLYHRFELLAENPQLGIVRDDVETGYRSCFEGSHSIFYHIKDGFIEIIRIPHQREDVKNMP